MRRREFIALLGGAGTAGQQAVHLRDLAATQAYVERHAATVDSLELGGVRTSLGEARAGRALTLGVVEAM